MDNQKVVGIFAKQQEAIAAIEKLKADGYTEDEISILAKDRKDAKKVTDETDIELETESPIEGAAGGAAAGGVVGGAGALLAQLGIIAIPGVGPFLAAGPIVAAIGGLVAGGAVGGIAGALVDMGLTREEAEEYSEYLERGNILVMVDKDEDDDIGKENKDAYRNIYKEHGGITGSFRNKSKKNKRDSRKNKKYEPGTPERPGDRGDPRRREDFDKEGPDGARDKKDPYRPEDPNPFV